MKDIIIIGAGYGGLVASALLAKEGHNVTVIEKNEQPGGKASLLVKDGFQFDMGPSWYMWPQAFQRFFSELGENASELLELKKLDPSYRVFFDDGDVIDISSNIEKNYVNTHILILQRKDMDWYNCNIFPTFFVWFLYQYNTTIWH